ncbi:ABC transporter ATP-binding protein [Luteimicrobium sp. NPDC057192]|uniref:ABC transporter ATP-binding protein n=1 Tax=Luteimicrobium sp. NPDC057192 TaxID=3346042 RepID=UPI003629AC46
MRTFLAAFREVTRTFGSARRRLILLATAAVVAGVVEAFLFALVAAVAVALSQGDDAVALSLGARSWTPQVSAVVILALALTLLRAVLQLYLAYEPSRISAEAMTTLRRRLFDAFSRASWDLKSRERAGSFQALVTTNAEKAALAVIEVARAMSWGLLFFAMFASALAISLIGALALVVVSALLLLLLRPLGRAVQRSAAQVSRATVEYAASIEEASALAEEIEVFGRADQLSRSFDEQTLALRRPWFSTRFLVATAPSLFQSAAILLLVTTLAVIWWSDVGAVASLAAVVLILVRSLGYGQQLQTSLSGLDLQLPFLRDVEAAIARYREHPTPEGNVPLPPIARIGMRDVVFAYDDGHDVLHGVSFDVGADEVVGIVGPSGAGKSTLTQILLRLRPPDRGALLVNGQEAQQFRNSDWHSRVAYVPQSSQVVWGSVADNIRFYRDDIADDAVEDAAVRVGLHDEILSWPDGYATQLGQRSSGLSGGQRQRLCLARALAADPDVLVLDEPTSALDVKSEMLVQETLARLRPGVIVFLIAHRLSTLSVCDRVMVVVDGRVEDFDTVDRLRLQNSFFSDITGITRAQAL